VFDDRARESAHRLAKNGGGSIVNIASVSALIGNVGRAAYGASKAALVNLSQTMASELASAKVRVNCVCSGPIATPLSLKVHTDQVKDMWHQAVPLMRYGTPDEVANLIGFLMDETLSSYITGQTISVDGGFIASGLRRG
jgi:NAD(P)-dependent dehydrogenase (short-subunit alcohol dehydrogenase family)